MESVTWMEWAQSLALAVALAATAGLRAWLPLLMAGLLSRAGYLQLGDSFSFLASTPALIAFGAATVLELAADKVPALDHALDALSTVVRPVAGSMLAAAALGVVTDPLPALALGAAVGAPSATVPHLAKSALRGASTAVTGGLANPLLSVIEDLGTTTLVVLAVLFPLLVVAALVAATAVVVRSLVHRSRPAVRTA